MIYSKDWNMHACCLSPSPSFIALAVFWRRVDGWGSEEVFCDQPFTKRHGFVLVFHSVTMTFRAAVATRQEHRSTMTGRYRRGT